MHSGILLLLLLGGTLSLFSTSINRSTSASSQDACAHAWKLGAEPLVGAESLHLGARRQLLQNPDRPLTSKGRLGSHAGEVLHHTASVLLTSIMLS